MRNCGLKTYGLQFGRGLANIQHLCDPLLCARQRSSAELAD